MVEEHARPQETSRQCGPCRRFKTHRGLSRFGTLGRTAKLLQNRTCVSSWPLFSFIPRSLFCPSSTPQDGARDSCYAALGLDLSAPLNHRCFQQSLIPAASTAPTETIKFPLSLCAIALFLDTTALSLLFTLPRISLCWTTSNSTICTHFAHSFRSTTTSWRQPRSSRIPACNLDD